MKLRLLNILLLTAYHVASHSQEIIYITPPQLFDEIKNSSKASVVQYWVPNCANVDDIVIEYKNLQNAYSNNIDFYFLGLTNKEELVANVVKKTGYNYKIYIIDKSVDVELPRRKETFSKEFCKLLDIEESDFITMYLDTDDSVKIKSNDIKLKKVKLKKIINMQ